MNAPSWRVVETSLNKDSAMNAKMIVLPLLALTMAGCEGVIVADRYPRRRVVYVERTAYVVAQPAPVVVAQPGQVVPPPGATVVPAPPTPVIIEEGATVNNVVVVAPATMDSYVLVGDEWYFWHPGLMCWVHAHRAMGWRPGPEIHVYHGWGEHPMYRHR